VSRFADRLGEASIRVSSPDGTIRLTANDRGELDVQVDPSLLSLHSDQSFADELRGCIVAALRAARREYVRARRDVFGDEVIELDGLPDEEVDDAGTTR
jgi:hypothetical protein